MSALLEVDGVTLRGQDAECAGNRNRARELPGQFVRSLRFAWAVRLRQIHLVEKSRRIHSPERVLVGVGSDADRRSQLLIHQAMGGGTLGRSFTLGACIGRL